MKKETKQTIQFFVGSLVGSLIYTLGWYIQPDIVPLLWALLLILLVAALLENKRATTAFLFGALLGPLSFLMILFGGLLLLAAAIVRRLPD